jgi:plasmid stability protein
MIAVLSLPCGKHHYSQAGDAVRSRLRVRAARHGRSMEEEAREILKGVLVEETSRGLNLARSPRLNR